MNQVEANSNKDEKTDDLKIQEEELEFQFDEELKDMDSKNTLSNQFS